MSVQSRTVQPRPTGSIRGTWRERFGQQYANVTVDPARANDEMDFRVILERRWGSQIGDTRTQDFGLSRAGAETLRDALTAALEWQPPTTEETHP